MKVEVGKESNVRWFTTGSGDRKPRYSPYFRAREVLQEEEVVLYGQAVFIVPPDVRKYVNEPQRISTKIKPRLCAKFNQFAMLGCEHWLNSPMLSGIWLKT